MKITLMIDAERDISRRIQTHWGGVNTEVFKPLEVEFKMYGILLSPEQYEKVHEKLKEIQDIINC